MLVLFLLSDYAFCWSVSPSTQHGSPQIEDDENIFIHLILWERRNNLYQYYIVKSSYRQYLPGLFFFSFPHLSLPSLLSLNPSCLSGLGFNVSKRFPCLSEAFLLPPTIVSWAIGTVGTRQTLLLLLIFNYLKIYFLLEYSCFTNIMLVSAIQKSALAIHVHISSLLDFFPIYCHHRALNTEFPCIAGSHQLPILCSSVYICLSHPNCYYIIDVKSIQHSSNHFNVYNSLAFHNFPMLCSHHLCLLLNHFSSAQNKTFYLLSNHCLSSPCQPLTATNLLISMYLPVLDISYKLDYTVCNLLTFCGDTLT